MRLSKLTAQGFKSFADKTEIAFDTPITCIVGPNGCGKSNVVDAIKWVLGEQSAKSLRGGAMLDVIFNGSSVRKPSGMASVTLTFDNQDRKLALDFDTATVTRQLYRDGSSEILIEQSTLPYCAISVNCSWTRGSAPTPIQSSNKAKSMCCCNPTLNSGVKSSKRPPG